MPKKRAAARPATRTVTITLKAPFEGWEAICRADFPLRVMADLSSENLDRVGAALDRIVMDHNFPDGADELATSMLDVDPFEGVSALAEGLSEALGKLPPR
jgi:hypothetical protein